MTTTAWALLAATFAFALTDWWAVWTDRPSVRFVAKPATLVALIGVIYMMARACGSSFHFEAPRAAGAPAK